MLTLFPDGCTRFEDSLMKMNVANVQFELFIGMTEGPYDEAVFLAMLDELVRVYRDLYFDFQAVFNSIHSVRVRGVPSRA